MTTERPPGPAAGPGSTPTAPAARRAWPRIAAVIAVLAVGCTAARWNATEVRRDAERREALVADQTASVVASTVQQLLAAVGGASGVPDADGHIDAATFDEFAHGAVDASPFQTLAVALVVPDAERATFEATTGGPIVDIPGGPAAARRPAYTAVWRVSPVTERTAALVGFDLLADPVRGAAVRQARDEGRTVITRTVAAQPSGDPAVFVVQPIYRPGLPEDASPAERRDAIAGYLTSGILGEALLEAVGSNVTDPPAIRIEDVPTEEEDASSLVLAQSDPPPGDGAVAVRSVGGRDWRVTVDDRQPTTTAAPWWILAATAALALLTALLAWRAARHQRDVERHMSMVEGIAGLGRSLTASGSVAELAQVVATEVPAVLGAERARFIDRAEDDGERDGGGDADTSTEAGIGTDRDTGSGTDTGTDTDTDSGTDTGTDRPAAADGPGRGPAVVARHAVAGDSGSEVGILEVTWADEESVDDLTLAGLSTVGEMCGQTVQRARLADRIRRDAISSRLLAGLAEAAATARTTEQVARTLVVGTAELPGVRSSHIGVLADEASALVVVHQGLDDDDEIDVRPLDDRWPIVDAFRQGEPVLLGDLDAVAARYPDVVEGMRAAGMAALACLPLADEDGWAFGVLGFTWPSPQRFDPELVRMLRTTADLCASSLERARATDRDQNRVSGLATLATHLAAATSFDEVGATIVDHAPAALDADVALVGVVEGDRFRLLVPDAPAFATLAPYTDISVDGDFPALIALRRRELVTFSTLDDVPDAAVAAGLARVGLHAGACAPLLNSADEATGVFVVLWARPPTFDVALRTRISTVADLCAQSAERARVFDDDHRLRRDLQHTVLTRTPTVAGVDVATRYLPAAQSVGLGGDWYDAIALDGGLLCLVVGDITGHGVAAVAEMTQVRTVVHTLAAGGMALPEILTHTSVAMQRDGLGYATVLIAVIDPIGHGLTYVTAGHPPPLVRRPGGVVETLSGGRHSVLGVDVVERPPGFVAFPPGSTLVLYTDGLIERRHTAIDTSIAQLADTLRHVDGLSVDALADHLLETRPASDAALDDVALVVARHLPMPAGSAARPERRKVRLRPAGGRRPPPQRRPDPPGRRSRSRP